MNKFKIGDQVRVYIGETFYRTKVLDFLGDLLCVKLTNQTYVTRHHFKQCRKLVKKPRREMWVRYIKNEGTEYAYVVDPENTICKNGLIHMREVIGKKS